MLKNKTLRSSPGGTCPVDKSKVGIITRCPVGIGGFVGFVGFVGYKKNRLAPGEAVIP